MVTKQTEGNGEKNDAKLKQLQATVDDYTSQLKRLQAEFENFQKRVQREHETQRQLANEKLLFRLLTIMDDFDHALSHLHSTNVDTIVIAGIEGICKNFMRVLEEYGVKPMNCKGQLFDPYKHEVMIQTNQPNTSDGTILEEIQKGYVIKDHILRTAKVAIAKNGGTQ
jgi:molecular chaperone GrpE